MTTIVRAPARHPVKGNRPDKGNTMHKIPALSLADAAWLSHTLERNRTAFGGWHMGPPDDGASGGGGADTGGAGKGTDAGATGGDAGKGADDAANKGADSGADKATDLGFPADTPVAEMTLAQQVAYHKHQSRKHEERATAYHRAAGGKTAAEVKAEMDAADALRREKMSADERAIEDARRQGSTTTAQELGPKMVRAAFKIALGDMPAAERDAEIDLLDLNKFLTDENEVDTDKVRRLAEKIAPTGKGTGGQRDYGQGSRGGATSSGVAAGSSRYQERRGKKTSA